MNLLLKNMKIKPIKAANPALVFFCNASGNAIISGDEISIPAAKHMKYSLALAAHSLFLYITQIPMPLMTIALRANIDIHVNVLNSFKAIALLFYSIVANLLTDLFAAFIMMLMFMANGSRRFQFALQV